MSYCAFENTTNDIRQCISIIENALEDGKNMQQFISSRSSDREGYAVQKLFHAVQEFVELYKELESARGNPLDDPESPESDDGTVDHELEETRYRYRR
jgi:DNA-binding winged helix-turn-helix (wHTH) protein